MNEFANDGQETVDNAQPSAEVDNSQSAPADAEGPSLHDELSAIWDESAKDEDEVEGDESGARERDESGRFKAKEPTESEGEASVDDQQSDDEEIEPETAPPAIDPPNSWSADKKALFGTLPPEAQEYIAQREQESHSAISQLGQVKQWAEPLAHTFANNQAYLESTGMDANTFVERAIHASYILDTNPIEGLETLAAQRGIDLAQYYGGQEYDDYGSPVAPDPQITQLKSTVQNLAQQNQQLLEKVQGIDQTFQQLTLQEAEQQYNAQKSEVSNAIDSFASSAPDLDKVAPELTRQVRLLKQEHPSWAPDRLLKEGYERAIWATPETREKRLQETQVQQSRQHAEKAKRASKSTVSTKRNQSPGEPQSVYEAQSEVWDRMHSS
jgi:hypothetical protein